MIANNSYNRKIIAEHLDKLSEDQFIDEIIIPLFSKSGYILYRRNIHGPGEHGKDLVFYRHVKLFYDNEYIVVQAKAEKVTTSNVAKFAEQLVRALKVPFPAKSRVQLFPNYVMFINSKTHSNDANFEFHYLADMRDNIKILSGENIVELIIEFDLQPEALKDTIELYETAATAAQDDPFHDYIWRILTSGDNIAINKLLDTDLKFDPRTPSAETKELIINYIFHKWEEDPSWDGTVKPMKWLKDYFDYISKKQAPKLIKVVEEYVSSYHSYKASTDTSAVVGKITPEQISSFGKRFFDIVVQETRNHKLDEHYLLKRKFEEFVTSDFMDDQYLRISECITGYLDTKTEILRSSDETQKEDLRVRLKELDNELYDFLYPDERPK